MTRYGLQVERMWAALADVEAAPRVHAELVVADSDRQDSGPRRTRFWLPVAPAVAVIRALLVLVGPGRGGAEFPGSGWGTGGDDRQVAGDVLAPGSDGRPVPVVARPAAGEP